MLQLVVGEVDPAAYKGFIIDGKYTYLGEGPAFAERAERLKEQVEAGELDTVAMI